MNEGQRLAIVPRPRGGEWLNRELEALRNAGVEVLVSLLTEEEARELDLQEEARSCRVTEIRFISFPIEDRSVPSSIQKTQELTECLHHELVSGKGVGVHCRAGIGRSALIAACVLIFGGLTAHDALGKVSKARGIQVPETVEQRSWVESFGKALGSDKT